MAVDINVWLERLGLGKYADRFAENEIDFDAARDLTEEDLKELGIPMGPRKKLLRALAETIEASNNWDEGTAKAASGNVPDPVRTVDAERRHMTVMFCDLVGSTELATVLDPEDMHSLLGVFQETCGRIAADHGGHIAKLLGDGLLVYFGYPRASEDDAERAVRAGLEIVNAVRRIETPLGGSLQSRIGLASGIVVIGDITSGGAGDPAAVSGSIPHLAARLESAAATNSILISDATRSLIGNLFSLEEQGQLELKGFSGPVAAFRVLGAADVESRFAATRAAQNTLFVGRDSELGMLFDRWEAAVEGDGQTVLITGEAGIGKSRLIEQLCERVSDTPHTRIRYQCSPQHTDAPLYPVISQLRRAARIKAGEATQVQVEKLVSLLTQAVGDVDAVAPLFADLLGITDVEILGEQRTSPQRFKELIFRALSAQLEGLAKKQPVLFIFEDHHWADPVTRELLALIVSRSRAWRVLIVVTSRPDSAPAWLDRAHTTQLNLSRLRRRGAVHISQNTAGIKLPDAIVEEILDKADGIPLFIEELTKTFVESGAVKIDAGVNREDAQVTAAIPATLYDSLMARLDRLSVGKDIAQFAAVLGRTFQVDLLVAASSRSKSDVEDVLRSLQTAGIIFQLPGTAKDTYEFKHALIRDAAYDSLTKASRASYHLSIAECLEENFPEIAETDPGLVAQHFVSASADQRSLRYLLRAGQIAHSRFALVVAARHLRRGLAILINQPPSQKRDETELVFQAALGPTLSSLDGYAAPTTAEAYERAYALLHLADDPKLKEFVLSGLLAVCSNRADIGRCKIIANEKLANAETANDDELFSSAYGSLAYTNSINGNFANAMAYENKAIQYYDSKIHKNSHWYMPHNTGVPLLVHLSLLLWHLGRVREADQKKNEALTLAFTTEHPNTIGLALFFLGLFGNLMRRDLKSVVASANKMIELTSVHGIRHWEASSLCYLACHHLAENEPGAALESLKSGRELLRQISIIGHRPVFSSIAGEALIQQGQFSEAIATLEVGLSDAKRTGELWFNAELNRLKGEAVLLQRPDDRMIACESFNSAIQIAQVQGSKMFELRATTSLASVAPGSDAQATARNRIRVLLSEIDADETAWDIDRARTCLEAAG